MNQKPREIWLEALGVIKKKVMGQTYETWFNPTSGVDVAEDTFTVQVPNRFFGDWIEDHYHDLIKSVLQDIVGIEVSVAYRIAEEPQEIVPVPVRPLKTEPIIATKPIQDVGSYNERSEVLYDGYTFDNYVVGTCNQFAYAASMAVVESPG